MDENTMKGPAVKGQTTSIPDLLTVEDVAERLHVPVSHVYRVAASGKLRHYRVGKRKLFTEQHVLDYLSTLEVEPPAKRGRPRKRFA